MRKPLKKFLSVCLTILLCYLLAVVINKVVFLGVLVEGTSMDPTLYDEEFGLSDKLFYKITGIHRFDIIVLDHDDDLLVKRVIGLPGETIKYIDNRLYVNDELVEEDFISEEVKCATCNPNGALRSNFLDEFNISFCTEVGVTLADDEYFVMGDNRASSWDSRYYRIGIVKKELIESKGLIIYGTLDSSTGKRTYQWVRFLGW